MHECTSATDCDRLGQDNGAAGLRFAMRRPVTSKDLPTVAAIVEVAGKVISPWDRMIGREVRSVARQYVKLLMRHRRLAAESKRARTKSSRDMILASRSAKICALLMSSKKKRSLGYYVSRADEVRPRRPSGEAIRVVSLPKGDGTLRAISTYGLIETAKQTLVRDVLIAQLGHSPYEFSRRGRGREAVIRNTLRALNKEGITHLVEADVRDCFPSTECSGLPEYLGLPVSVVENTVRISPSSYIDIDKDLNISNRTVRAGLPLGSRLSPFIMSKIIEPILDRIDLPIARSFVDNIGFGARSEGAAAEGKSSLAVLLDQHPAGPFTLKYSTAFSLGGENDVLGYLIRPQSEGYPGIARATPSKPSILRAQRKLAIAHVYSALQHRFEAIDAWSVTWASRYPCWRGQKNGATSAFHAAYDWVIPHVTAFQRDLRRERFASFAEMTAAAQVMASTLESDPSYHPLQKYWNAGKPIFPFVSPY